MGFYKEVSNHCDTEFILCHDDCEVDGGLPASKTVYSPDLHATTVLGVMG